MVALATLVAACPAIAQEQDPGSPDPEITSSLAPPPVMSVDEAPEIDGVFDEIWQAGTLLPDTWTQVDPDEGAPPTERTEVRLMRDSRNLYIGVRCFDREPDKLIGRALRRDSTIYSDDHVKESSSVHA